MVRHFAVAICATIAITMWIELNAVAAAEPVFDDFDDNLLDSNKWTTRIPHAGQGNFRDSRVEEGEGALQLVDRGYLVTRDEFDPAQGIAITGQAMMAPVPSASPADVLSIVTRSTAEPDMSFGEVRLGTVSHLITTLSGTAILQIVEHHPSNRTDGQADISRLAAVDLPGTLLPGELFNFSLIDTGASISFSVWKPGGEVTTVATESLFSSPQNFVALYNRETSEGAPLTRIMRIENLSIVPEPSSIVLLLMGSALALLQSRRMRSRLAAGPFITARQWARAPVET